MNKEQLISELEKINVNMTEEQMKMIEEFCFFLIEESKKTNLTAIKTTEEIFLKHIYDSLTLSKAVNFKEINSVLDIGSGAGFPGIILKIVYPHLNMTLLDSNNKKCVYLNKVINKFSLKNIEVINIRAENYNRREYFDLVTARAVTNLRVLSELSLPFVKVNGYFIALKSHIKEELLDANEAIEILNCEIKRVIEFKLPFENSIRNLVVIEKISETPLIYPRSYDKIIRNPLKKKSK